MADGLAETCTCGHGYYSHVAGLVCEADGEGDDGMDFCECDAYVEASPIDTAPSCDAGYAHSDPVWPESDA